MLQRKVMFGLRILPVAALVSVAAAMMLRTEPDCSGGGRLCEQQERESTSAEKMAKLEMYERRSGAIPPGDLRKAYERKQAMMQAKSDVSGADGIWREYGRGGLISSGLAQTIGLADVPDTNLLRYAGRVDNFAYDPVAVRLFAAVGTGGIWMSEAVAGDVRTLADRWVSISDNLPTQATGAVVWTPAGGGTIIAPTGDSVMSTGGQTGLGAFWSNDLGATWHQSSGFPDEVKVFNARADLGNPDIVYVATSRGLFRSEDAGRSFTNARLPTPGCAGNEDPSSKCLFANMVSDVAVMAPGGVTNFECSREGCPVVAAVGWRAGRQKFQNSEIEQSPGNGLYKSPTGVPGTFVRLELPTVDSATEMGFAPPERTGRIEMGNAIGPDQDHNYLYALVQDSESLNGTSQSFDPPLDALLGEIPLVTHMNGIYVSADFGDTWTRMAAAEEVATIPGAFAALVPPGVQSWYNMWVQPDPTRFVPGLGIPTRMVFGLEEIFSNLVTHAPLNGIAQMGPQDFQNIGRYFSATGADLTTHPDQHAGVFVPTAEGGVCVFAGNDGGVYKQCVLPGEEFDNNKWGIGANYGFYTLLPYGLGVAKDGTVWFGFQDNGSGHMDPDGLSYGDFGADGFYAEVDPDNSDISYTESQNGGLRRTIDRGATATTIAPAYTEVQFANWFSMDPLNAKHMITTANEVYETLDAPNVTSATWKRVFRLGKSKISGGLFAAQFGDVHGEAIYVGYCGGCGVTVNAPSFDNGIATNIGGDKPPKSGTPDGWHHASAKGLPKRLIRAVEIDPDDARTVYVALGGYMSGLRPPGHFGDPNTNLGTGYLFKSTDAGENFTDITGDLPQMPIATVIVRGDQLIVGTDLGVFISSDRNGSHWATLGKNLTTAPVAMLKLQPGNPNHLFAATFGRHIWHYEFTGDAEIAPARSTGNAAQGRGLFLGAVPPMLLVGLLGLALLRARRR